MLRAASLALSGVAEEVEEAAPLLDLLGWDGPAAPAVMEDRSRLLQAAASCRRVFQLRAPDAPGMHVFGAEIDLAAPAGEAGLPVIGTSGVGADAGDAFASCIGEAVELLAQVETPAQRQARSGPGGDMVTLHAWSDSRPHPWPLDRCLRRAPQHVVAPAPAPLSIGCATGRTDEEAILRGALELVERDAVALWWRGGRAGRLLPLESCGSAVGLLRHLRQDCDRRRTWMLDITSDLGVPCVAAISFGADGTGFCFGTAARADFDAAACAALLELCQNELAQVVVEAKRRERGDAALNPRDLAILRRFTEVRPDPAWAVLPMGAPRDAVLGGADVAERIAALSTRLAAAGLELMLFDHSANAEGMAVWRTVCDGLACEPSSAIPPRLAQSIAETGGGPGITMQVSLYV